MTTFIITDFGAIGDGQTLDSPAIQKAINAAATKGGTVVVPPGVFLCGTIHLKSRVTLHLWQGATILGSPNLSDYTEETWGHHDDRTPYHLIFAAGNHGAINDIKSLSLSIDENAVQI